MNWIEESALEVLIEKLFNAYFDDVVRKKITPVEMTKKIWAKVKESFPGKEDKEFQVKVLGIIIKICHDIGEKDEKINSNERSDNNGKTANENA